MRIFNSLRESVFMKSDSDAKKQYDILGQLLQQADGETRKRIETDMKLLDYGIKGEEAIAYELRNSFMPMIVLHDLYFEVDGKTAQIDYIIITRKTALVVECKNLIGNIEINNRGEFIRTYTLSGVKKREGIYSPITQNQRHLDVIRAMQVKGRGWFARALLNKTFASEYHSIVVLANPKALLNYKYAKREVKSQVIRCDQLVAYIKDLNNRIRNVQMTDEQMYSWAEMLLRFHKEREIDYNEKYGLTSLKSEEMKSETEVKAMPETEDNDIAQTIEEPEQAIETDDLYRELKQFRLDMSRAYQIKPYYLYNNLQLEELVRRKPQNMEQLKQIPGFGPVKCEKWGREILEIIRKRRSSQ